MQGKENSCQGLSIWKDVMKNTLRGGLSVLTNDTLEY